MPKVKSLLLLIIASSLLSGCIRPAGGPVHNLRDLYRLGSSGSGFRPGGVTNIRHLALEELGVSVGARTGLQQRGEIINTLLKKHARDLDRTFNFHAMILPHNVLPPVLLDGHNTINIDKPNMIRLTDRTYTIHKQARFVTGPPNWREYLFLEYRTPESPHPSLLPRTRAERNVWNQAVRKGFMNGIRQADSIFSENLARLKQDFQGMVIYRKLIAQGMVSAPYVAKINLGVTGDSERLDINDQVLHITAMPSMQTNSKNWIAAVTKDHAAGSSHAGLMPATSGKFAAPSMVISQQHMFK